MAPWTYAINWLYQHDPTAHHLIFWAVYPIIFLVVCSWGANSKKASVGGTGHVQTARRVELSTNHQPIQRKNGISLASSQLLGFLSHLRFKGRIRRLIIFLACLLALVFSISVIYQGTTGSSGGSVLLPSGGGASQGMRVSTRGLTREDLQRSSELVAVEWTTWRPGKQGFFGWVPVPDATATVWGSACVFAYGDHCIQLVTNRHMLEVEAILRTRTTDLVVKQYDIEILFPSGARRRATRIGYPGGDIDLAFLKVDATGLRNGVDFVGLPLSHTPAQIGDDVVAVGNPGFGGQIEWATQTFGHISGFRSEQEMERPGSWIQTDAAINHGNSGGPLLVNRSNRFFWIGVNTLTGAQSTPGINFALDASQLPQLRADFYDCTKEGVSEILRNRFGASLNATQ